MSNFDTVRTITDNLQAVLQKQGIQFSRKSYDDPKNVPASLIPLGRIFYSGEAFENAYGERPLYIEAEFILKIFLSGRDAEDLIREEQKWVHKIREALTPDALNTGALASTKYVSRVTIARFEALNQKDTSALSCRALIRYREV